MDDPNAVHVYALGFVHCSACAPLAMQPSEVEARVNEQSPTGIASGWHISDSATFRGGEPMPGPCDTMPENRRHWLLVC